MADYYPLIARAIEGLGTSAGEARRALYERARTALVTQLRSVEPALSESDITKERLALEDAIRKVEAETARRQRTEPRKAAPPLRPQPPTDPRLQPPPQSPPARRDRPSPPPGEASELRTEQPRAEEQRPVPPPVNDAGVEAPDAPRSATPPSARSLLLNARTSSAPREPFRPFRNVVNEVDDLGAASAKSAQSARSTRDSYGSTSPQNAPADEGSSPPSGRGRIDQHFDAGEADTLDHDLSQLSSLEPSYDVEDEPMLPQRYGRQPPPRPMPADEDYVQPRPPRSYRGLIRLAVVLLIFAGLAATVSWQWPNITGLYTFISHMRARQVSHTTETPAQPKFSGRVPQDQGAGQQPSAGGTDNQPAPSVAQRVVLYEEDQSNPQGKRFVGSVIWRTETVSPGPGLAPELEVRADVEIPERQMHITWKLRRNTDPALPASHTIEIMFNLPPDFPGGGIANVPGVLLKQSEDARGTPLAGIAVKVTSSFFLLGLNSADADVQRNMALLKDRPWFDIPLVYTNGVRAILAIEKGPPGDRAFADAFAAWGK